MSKEQVCDFCHTGEDTVSICGTLHKDYISGKPICAHHKCMQYSALLVQYKSDVFGGFKKKEVQREINRGKKLACHLCKTDRNRKKIDTKGATSGCAVSKCNKTFHYYCVSMNPKTVAKRYKVSAGSKEVILYRVFCSKLHEEQYRDNISAEDIAGQTPSSGEEDADADEDDKEDSSETEDDERTTTKRNYETPSQYNGKRSRVDEGFDEPATSGLNHFSSPEMTADEVVFEARRHYQELLEKQEKRNQSARKNSQDSTRNTGVSIDTDSGEGVTEDFNTSNGPSPDETDVSDTESMLNTTPSDSVENVTEDFNTSDSPDETDVSDTESMLNTTPSGVLILIPSKLEVADLKTICGKADLPVDSILLWPPCNRGLKDKHMPFVMWDLASRVRKGNQDYLINLLSDGSPSDYETLRSSFANSDTNIIEQVKLLVNDVNIRYNCEVFRLLTVPIGDMDLSLLVFTIPDDLLNGPHDLFTNFAVCQWTQKTVLSYSNDRIVDFPLEKKLLLKWLSHRLGRRYELFVHPKETTLKCRQKNASAACSVTARLKSLSQNSFSDCPVKVLVVQNVDRHIVRYKSYIQKLLESFVFQHPGYECFCIIDVLPGDDIREISDIVPASLVELGLQLYSALPPTFYQVSCVVLHIDKDIRYEGKRSRQSRVSNSQVSPTIYVDVDGTPAK